MRVTTLDTIVKGMLISKGYPIHWYFQFLYWGSRAYEELHFDTLKSIKTVKLPINEYRAVQVPCDFMDIVQIGIPHGQFVKPLSKRPGLTKLNNFDSEGNKVKYGEGGGADNLFFDGLFFNGYTQIYNYQGEFTGRLFGAGSGDNPFTYTFVPERKEIQLHESLVANDIILQYITDGTDIDNATMITPYAKAAIEAYIEWQLKEHNRSVSLGEKDRARQLWMKQHSILRGRMNPITKQEIMAIVRKNTHGSIKG